MDTNRKNNDCYFYYYSTCMKGDNCLFRHEETALGCEEVCQNWQQGKCFNQRCNLRHMELKKNRKAIPCYWESKPTGCCKPHCPFRHDLPRTTKSKEGSNETNADTTLPKRGSQGSETSFGNPSVDPLVVNFEEESDNESVPSSTPQKMLTQGIHVKTLEEIRLEKIQAESAAFYSFAPKNTNAKGDLPFKVLTLDEIRRSKLSERDETQSQPDSTTSAKLDEEDKTVESKDSYLNKPVKLRRFLKRSADEPVGRTKLKRTKLLESDAVRSKTEQNEESDDLLKSIDDLLSD